MGVDIGEYLYVGSYGPEHGGSGAGVVTVRRDPESGLLSAPIASCLTRSPSYLALHPDGHTLYATHEHDAGAISALRIKADGALTRLGDTPTGGDGPCHVMIHPAGEYAFVTNYQSGTVALIPLQSDGTLSPARQIFSPPGRATGRRAHPHTTLALPGGAVGLVDLGRDLLVTYLLTRDGLRLDSAIVSEMPGGTGPRTLALGTGTDAFLANELSSTITRLAYDSPTRSFVVTATERSTRRSGSETNYPAEVRASPDGRHVYLCNRGSDTISVFAAAGAGLQFVSEVPSGGKWPQHLVLLDGFLYVANQKSHNIAVHVVDAVSGRPLALLQTVEVRSPSCLLGHAAV